MKSVLLSIRPEWCWLIASGKKTVEVRKTKPKLKTPFKVYIYCTKDEPLYNSGEKFWCGDELGNGKVIGEFVCRGLTYIEAGYDTNGNKHLYNTAFIQHRMCIPEHELHAYLYKSRENCGGWAWHISDAVIYHGLPKKINEFVSASVINTNCFGQNLKRLTRAPQSWCYVEEATP